MDEEKKDVVEVKAAEKKDEGTETKSNPDPAHDHHQAIHGFGVAQHWLFVPGIILSAASLTLAILFAILLSVGTSNSWSANLLSFFRASKELNNYCFGLFSQALIGGIVCRCLLHHFKSDDPNWKDKVDDYTAY
ncbi:MAG: hypothetical protein BWY98_00012 [Tenericutes bacterium ADurb.BinA155]|jgi:phosphotransferase system  glucose/maltose/N-acetylglucosamine-specific IIC component|nr:MAG: hypothetical protein BWY98_00012 [Tenericutes bacterium ADurb.BinA155]